MNNKQQIAVAARRIIEQNGVCKGELCKHCPCGLNVSGYTCRIESDMDEESDEAVKICQQWLIDNGYDLQQKEATMKEQKEIKFQDRTRDGYEYRIYTREGMSDKFPLVGEVLSKDRWGGVQCWTKDGYYYNSDDESDFDLIPIEPAELEGLKVGDGVYCVDMGGEINRFPIKEADFNSVMIWDDFWVTRKGMPYCTGNGQQMFYRSAERALASIRGNNNVK